MKFQIANNPYVKTCKLPKLELSAKQKFERLAFKLEKRNKLRKYHFNLIPHNGNVVLFDGLGKELDTYAFTVEGIRQARIDALAMFQEAENQNGGYSVTAPTMDFLTSEELAKIKQQTSNLLNYNPFIICKDCKFQFEDIKEKINHRCSESWVILEFRRVA